MPSDKIQLEGMVFYGYHGVGPEEQSLGQRFIVDLEIERDTRPAGLSDNINDTINYSKLYQTVRGIMEGPSRKLLENVAETISQSVLQDFDVEAVRVKVMKPEVPMKGSILKHAAVEIYRSRDAI